MCFLFFFLYNLVSTNYYLSVTVKKKTCGMLLGESFAVFECTARNVIFVMNLIGILPKITML